MTLPRFATYACLAYQHPPKKVNDKTTISKHLGMMFETPHSFQGTHREDAGREPKSKNGLNKPWVATFHYSFSYPSTDRGSTKSCFRLSTFTTDPHIYRRLIWHRGNRLRQQPLMHFRNPCWLLHSAWRPKIYIDIANRGTSYL